MATSVNALPLLHKYVLSPQDDMELTMTKLKFRLCVKEVSDVLQTRARESSLNSDDHTYEDESPSPLNAKTDDSGLEHDFGTLDDSRFAKSFKDFEEESNASRQEDSVLEESSSSSSPSVNEDYEEWKRNEKMEGDSAAEDEEKNQDQEPQIEHNEVYENVFVVNESATTLPLPTLPPLTVPPPTEPSLTEPPPTEPLSTVPPPTAPSPSVSPPSVPLSIVPPHTEPPHTVPSPTVPSPTVPSPSVSPHTVPPSTVPPHTVPSPSVFSPTEPPLTVPTLTLPGKETLVISLLGSPDVITSDDPVPDEKNLSRTHSETEDGLNSPTKLSGAHEAKGENKRGYGDVLEALRILKTRSDLPEITTRKTAVITFPSWISSDAIREHQRTPTVKPEQTIKRKSELQVTNERILSKERKIAEMYKRIKERDDEDQRLMEELLKKQKIPVAEPLPSPVTTTFTIPPTITVTTTNANTVNYTTISPVPKKSDTLPKTIWEKVVNEEYPITKSKDGTLQRKSTLRSDEEPAKKKKKKRQGSVLQNVVHSLQRRFSKRGRETTAA